MSLLDLSALDEANSNYDSRHRRTNGAGKQRSSWSAVTAAGRKPSNNEKQGKMKLSNDDFKFNKIDFSNGGDPLAGKTKNSNNKNKNDNGNGKPSKE